MKILEVFSPEEQAHIICRLGWLNVWSPIDCDGGLQLCLERREEVGSRGRRSGLWGRLSHPLRPSRTNSPWSSFQQLVARLLVHMGCAEPGENWLCQQWRFNRFLPPIPGTTAVTTGGRW